MRTLSSVSGSMRSPTRGSGPPLPLSLVAKCALSCARASARKMSPRTRPAAASTPPGIPGWNGAPGCAAALPHDDAIVAVHRLMGEVVRPLRFPWTLQVTRLRIRPADALVGAALVPLELLRPLFAALSGSPLKLLQPFLSSAASSFRKKCSRGIRSSIITMCIASCIPPPQAFFLTIAYREGCCETLRTVGRLCQQRRTDSW